MRLRPPAVLLLALAVAPAAAQTLLKSWDGGATDDNFGRSVAFAGDVNGDGYDDVIVGAPFADPGGLVSAGRASIYSGKDGGLLRTFNGAQAGERQGWSVAGVGDVNGDGVDDVAVSAIWFNKSASLKQYGAVRVYSGATGAQLYQRVGPQTGAFYGTGLDGVGDWNGDGTPDVAAGAPYYAKLTFPLPVQQVGYADVFSGANGSQLMSLMGTNEHDNLGNSVAGAGDVDGGGVQDLVVGLPGADTLVGYGGKAQVVRGETNTVKFTLIGLGSFGQSVDGGDFNGDGLADIVVGAYFENDSAGAVHVYFGPSGAVGQAHKGTLNGDFLGNSVTCVGDADGDGCDDLAAGAYQTTQAGYAKAWSGKTGAALYNTIVGQNLVDHFGIAVGGGGDANGDGWPDLAVGADLHDGVGKPDAGRAYVYDLFVHQTSIGFGGPGTALLDVYGAPLSAGKQASLLLSGAAPNRPATLYVSPGLNPIPFKGGLLAPEFATSTTLGFVTDAQGKVFVPGIKGGGGPYDVYIQFVIKDKAQPKGFALSNTVKLHFLP